MKKKPLMLKSYLIPAVCIIFIILLITFSKVAISSALKGIDLWLNVVFPSLFPFLVASELISGTNFIRAVGILLEPVMRPLFNVPGFASFPLAIGITSGYPVGAKVIVSMKQDKLLNKQEAERLLAFCNNSSPLFITGAVAAGMLKQPNTGLLLLLCHIAAGISVGLIFRQFYPGRNMVHKNSPAHSIPAVDSSVKNFGNALGNAVINSVTTLLTIGGFIILFSVIISLLIEVGLLGAFANLLYLAFKFTELPKDLFVSLSGGIIEITTGLGMLSSIENISLNVRLIATSAIIGWGGISVYMQIFSIAYNAGLSTKPYLIGKLLQSCIATLYTLIIINLTNILPQPVIKVFSYYKFNTPELNTWSQYLFNSCKQLSLITYFFILIIIMAIIVSLLGNLLAKLYNNSIRNKLKR